MDGRRQSDRPGGARHPGTLSVNPEDLIRPVLAGLADAAVLVVATTGRADQTTLPFPMPENARVAGILPYDQLLPLTSVVITNGGWAEFFWRSALASHSSWRR